MKIDAHLFLPNYFPLLTAYIYLILENKAGFVYLKDMDTGDLKYETQA